MKSTNSTVELSSYCQKNVIPYRRGEHCSSVKIYKKALSLFLSLVMLFSITTGLDFSAYAQTYSGTCGDNVTWSLDTSTGQLTISGSGNMTNYSYSSDVPWCNQREEIKIVNIRYGVISIGGLAFYGCRSLTSISIPNSVTSIDYKAFYDCTSLTSITIPNSVEIIAGSAFDYCTSLTSINIPNSVIDISFCPFSGCTSLTSISVSPNNKYYASQDGVLFNKNKTTLIRYPSKNARTSYTIPSSVAMIGSLAFRDGRTLTSVTIPYGVATIDSCAFYKCKSLKNVSISDSVTKINRGAFEDCSSLTSVIIPKNITVLQEDTFYGCSSLISVTIPNSVWGIGRKAFHQCTSLTSVYYCGTSSEWSGIYKEEGNDALDDANLYYHNYKTRTTKATTSKNGSIVTKCCTACGNVPKDAKVTTIYYPKTITLSTTSYTYNGKVKKPSVTVKDAKGKKISSKYYTVSYSKGRKNVGRYTVTIKFKGNYSGTVKKTFTIKPKAATLSKVTAGKKAFTVKWKKQTTQTTGYQIQYSTSSKFKNAKTVTVSKNKTTSKKISKLKTKKKYYVRIRTYKTVKVNGKNTKIYSGWSKAKTVKTK